MLGGLTHGFQGRVLVTLGTKLIQKSGQIVLFKAGGRGNKPDHQTDRKRSSSTKQQIEERLEQGIDIVLDIDWQGAQQIRQLIPSAISIFLLLKFCIKRSVRIYK